MFAVPTDECFWAPVRCQALDSTPPPQGGDEPGQLCHYYKLDKGKEERNYLLAH